MSQQYARIRLRRGTASEWSSSSPQPNGEVLKLGEPGYETDTGKLKIGDGVTGWNNLEYFAGGASLSIEQVQDSLGTSFLVAGSGIGLNYDDENDTLTINSTGNANTGDITFNGTTISTIDPDQNITINSNGNGDIILKEWEFKQDGTLNLPEGKTLNFGQNTDTLGPPIEGGGTDRVRLWDFKGGGSNYNYAIGVEGNHIWFSMDVNNGTGGYKYYSRDNEIFKISDDSKLVFPNGTWVSPGTFDNGTSGNSGVSLNCAVGYELNWQGGHLKSTYDNGITASNILVDSALEFPGSGINNLQIDNTGLTFPDGSTQTTAAVNFSGSYNDLTDLPVLFDGSYTSLTDLPVLFDGSYTSLTDTPPNIVSDTTGITGASSITNIVSISQADYNALTPDPNTLYVIV